MKKGFTLIEILVVITLLATLSITIGVNVTGMLQRQTEEKFNDYEETVADAGCVWAEVNNKKYSDNVNSVSISTLISGGYLKKDLTNPSTKETVDKETNEVIITWENNNTERKCTFSARKAS